MLFFETVFASTYFRYHCKKAFLEFGVIHDIFSGKFSKANKDISNGNYHYSLYN